MRLYVGVAQRYARSVFPSQKLRWDVGYKYTATLIAGTWGDMYRKTKNTAGFRPIARSPLPTRQQRSSADAADSVAATFDLTPAEIRTLERLLGGRSPAEIAGDLRVALPTVRTHLSNIFAKTGTARQLDLILLAVQLTTPRKASWLRAPPGNEIVE